MAHGFCLRSGKMAPSEKAQRELADELRARVSKYGSSVFICHKKTMLNWESYDFVWYILYDSTKTTISYVSFIMISHS